MMLNDDIVQLTHGGGVRLAASQYAIPENEWLDLSTGINPDGWQVPELPDNCWQRLPEPDNKLLDIARDYYGCKDLLHLPGTQAAIQVLPKLRSKSVVGIVSPTYSEHYKHWNRYQHKVLQLELSQVEEQLEKLDVLVVVNPNNPTGKLVAVDTLLKWEEQLSAKNGWLVVDEAFIDVTPESSLLSKTIKDGVIVLRSLGKFFGLAGIRSGFVVAEADLLEKIEDQVGLWAINHPGQLITRKALADKKWIAATRRKLPQSSNRLKNILQSAGLNVIGGTALFQLIAGDNVEPLYEMLARRGVLTRLFNVGFGNTKSAMLRFGLPNGEQEWDRLIKELVK